MIYMFLANGFEEIEALAVVDILRRADLQIKTVSVQKDAFVTGSHNITVTADLLAQNENFDDIDAVILPGGIPGTPNLKSSDIVQKIVKKAYDDKKLVCAICAAPTILGEMGILKDKNATCYPGNEDKLIDAIYNGADVEICDNVITAKAAGVSHIFAFEIIKYFKGIDKADAIKKSMHYK